jgi:hypothetical protein
VEEAVMVAVVVVVVVHRMIDQANVGKNYISNF